MRQPIGRELVAAPDSHEDAATPPSSATGWQRYHRRAALLRDLVQLLDRSGAGEPPWNDALAAEFAGPGDLLGALHDTWFRRLSSHVDMAVEIGQEDLADSVAAAWRTVEGDLPGVRRVLDRFADDPVIARRETREHRLLAVAAGLATLADPPMHSARLGKAFVERLRAASPSPPDAAPRGGLLGWFRQRRAAPLRSCAPMGQR